VTYLQAIILGIVQGLTEYLPISSSAHLVIVPYLFQWKLDEKLAFSFDVLVQLGTLAAVIIYYWKDLWSIIRCFMVDLFHGHPFASQESRLGWYLILATIPAGIFGLLIRSQVEAAFGSMTATAVFLLVTALLLFLGEHFSRREYGLESMNWKDALVIGLFQAVSIFPGVSRSGSTITGGLLRGMERPTAARFSFLMAIPIMLAAGILSLFDLQNVQGLASFIPVIAIGFITAGVVGYLSIRWLLTYLTRHSLTVFSIYCTVVGVGMLVLTYVR
jgi:undecaprenyl-diphosphatase